MKVYSLYAWESGANYFLSVSDVEDNDKKFVSVILNVQELKPHAQYKVSVIRPDDHKMDTVIIHGGFLTMDNLTNIAYNFANNIDDLLYNTAPYEISIDPNDD